MDQQVFDVIIIGAGIAGLAAGAHLQQAGYHVLILEAQGRVGGRILTDYSLESPLDLGASWIHGSKRNPIAALAAKFNIKTVPSNTESLSHHRYDSLFLYDWNGKRVEGKELQQMKKRLEELEIFIKDAQLIFDKDVSYYSVIKKFISFHHFTERELKIFKYAVKAAVEYEFAEDMAKLSFNAFGKDEPFPPPDVLFPQGYSQIPQKLAENLPIKLNQIVQKIIYNEDGVKVLTNQGHFQARTALITIPLGVLKKTATELFNPGLPRWKQQAIRRLQVGLLNKVYLKFDQPFWDLNSEVIGFIPTAKLSWIEFINYYPYLKQPILLAFNAGSRARAMQEWPPEKMIDSIMQVMRTVYGDKAIPPTTYVMTDWEHQPFAQGSYSYLPVGASENDCDKLAEPVLEKLFFAGEATNYKMIGTVHGAYLSGLHTAKLIEKALKSSGEYFGKDSH